MCSSDLIINDRYGVKINEVRKEKAPSLPKQAKGDSSSPEEQAQEGTEEKKGDEDFDYSYFEVEDESI